MHERRSKSVAIADLARRSTPRLVTPFTLLGLAGLVAAALYALYPAEQYLRLLAQASFDDPLTARLARGILIERPQERHLYATLIQAELRRGRFELAADLAWRWRQQALSKEETNHAYLLAFKALREGWYAQLPGTPERVEAGLRLRDLLTRHEGIEPSLEQRLDIIATLGALDTPLPILLGWLPSEPVTDATDTQRIDIARLLIRARQPQLAFQWLSPLSDRLDELTNEDAAFLAAVALAANQTLFATHYFTGKFHNTTNLNEARAIIRQILALWMEMDRLDEGLKLIAELEDERPEVVRERSLLIELIKAARSRGRRDLAVDWATELLRLSLLGQAYSLALGQDYGFRPAAWSGDRPPPSSKPFNLPFDQEAYDLAFQVMVEANKLDEAWMIARAAIAARRSDPLWRKRLAEVSEWTGRPRLALEHWQWLANKQDTPLAWDAIIRLAPGLMEWDALRLAYEHKIQQTNNRDFVKRLAKLLAYLGDAEALRALLEREARHHPSPWALEMLATTLGEMGELESAISAWQQLERLQPLNPIQSMRLATLFIIQGRLQQALEVLESAPQPDEADKRREVLIMRLELARMLGLTESARRSLTELEHQGLLRAEDSDKLYALLERHAPEEAAMLASRNWSLFGRVIDLERALYQYSRRRRWKPFSELINQPSAHEIIQQRPELLKLVAIYHQARGELTQAYAVLNRAFQLSPYDSNIQADMMWILMAMGRNEELEMRLQTWEARLAQDVRWHEMLAMAYQHLSKPAVALERYLRPHAKERQDDPLWVMNFADALEQNGQLDLAWRVRRSMWTKLHPLHDTQWMDRAAFNDMLRIARTQLIMAADPGDRSLGILRELIAHDIDDSRQLSENARVLVTAWLQSQGQFEAERGWMWTRFAQSLTRPLWGEISSALNLDDVARIGELLEARGGSLPRYDRVNALRRVHELPGAQTTAFEMQDAQRDDQDMQRYLEEVLLAHSDHISLNSTQRRDNNLDETSYAIGLRSVLGTRLALYAQWVDQQRDIRERNVLRKAYNHRSLGLELEWLRYTSNTRIGLSGHEAVTHWVSLSARHRGRIDRRIGYEIDAGWRHPSTLSNALRLAGWQHQLKADLSYSLSARDHFSLSAAWQAFETQTGHALGDGTEFLAGYTHWFRMDARDLGADLFVRRANYYFNNDIILDDRLKAIAPLDAPLTSRFFGVDDSIEYGLRLHSNMRFAQKYTRDWRPYGSIALLHNSITGTGHDIDVGLSGSLFGTDHLNVFLRSTSSRESANNTTTLYGINYLYLF